LRRRKQIIAKAKARNEYDGPESLGLKDFAPKLLTAIDYFAISPNSMIPIDRRGRGTSNLLKLPKMKLPKSAVFSSD